MGEAFVCSFGHSAFLQHVIAYVDEDLELLLSGELVGIITFFDDVEHHFLGSDHQKCASEVSSLSDHFAMAL